MNNQLASRQITDGLKACREGKGMFQLVGEYLQWFLDNADTLYAQAETGDYYDSHVIRATDLLAKDGDNDVFMELALEYIDRYIEANQLAEVQS